jgi:hypothetical protein
MFPKRKKRLESLLCSGLDDYSQMIKVVEVIARVALHWAYRESATCAHTGAGKY